MLFLESGSVTSFSFERSTGQSQIWGPPRPQLWSPHPPRCSASQQVLQALVRHHWAAGVTEPGWPPAPDSQPAQAEGPEPCPGLPVIHRSGERVSSHRAFISRAIPFGCTALCTALALRQPKKGRRQRGQEYQLWDIFPRGKTVVSHVLINHVLSPLKRSTWRSPFILMTLSSLHSVTSLPGTWPLYQTSVRKGGRGA